VDICKWEVSFEPKQRLRVRGLGGEALFALVINLIGRIDPEVARKLHDEKGLKPLSVGPIIADAEPQAGFIPIEEGSLYSFRFSTLSESLTELIWTHQERLVQEPDLKLAGAPVEIVSFRPNPVEKPPPGTSYENILEAARPAQKLRLRFLSPTSFRKEGEQVFLPLPDLVFKSLLFRWNAFSPTRFPTSILTAIERIKLAKFRCLSSSIVNFSTYRIIGFTGEVTFGLPHPLASEIAKMLDALADFAYYCGVGYKTTMGMGQAERV